MEKEIQNAAPSPTKGTYGPIAKKYRQAAYYLLLLWCLLPLIMCVVFAVMALTGQFPTLEELAAEGLTLGYINYDNALAIYQRMYFVLGGITVCFALMMLVLSRRRIFRLESLRNGPWFYLFALFLVWAFVCTMLSDYRHYALVGGGYMRDGLVSYFIYGAVFLCASMLQREEDRKKLMLCFIGVIGFLALIMLIQDRFDIFFLNYCFPSFRAVVFNQFNHLGYMLCMTGAAAGGFFLYESGSKRRKLLFLVLFLYLSGALIVNDTFGSLLALMAAVPVMLLFYWRSGRKVHWRALGLAVLVGVIGVVLVAAITGEDGPLGNFIQLKTDVVKILTHAEDAGNAGTDRFQLWQETVVKIRKRPIFGYGPQGLIRRHALTDAKMPHNTYLQIMAYTGIPGFILYLAAMLSLVVQRWRKIKALDAAVLIAAGAAFAYMVSAAFGAPIFNAEPYFWLFLGFVTLMNEREEPLIYLEAPEA